MDEVFRPQGNQLPASSSNAIPAVLYQTQATLTRAQEESHKERLEQRQERQKTQKVLEGLQQELKGVQAALKALSLEKSKRASSLDRDGDDGFKGDIEDYKYDDNVEDEESPRRRPPTTQARKPHCPRKHGLTAGGVIKDQSDPGLLQLKVCSRTPSSERVSLTEQF